MTDGEAKGYSVVELRGASDAQLEELSKKGLLSLSLEEMKRVQAYYEKEGRDPTDVELEAIAQTWSEHCGHKTFKGRFNTSEGEVDNLFKTFIAKATRELNKEWCVSVFEDNAGVIDFNGDHALAFKVETHNHPSALEPFGGAATGVGGVIRDVLGVWGDPIANTDVLCFGPLDFPAEKLVGEMKHPRYLYDGVVSGISCYGNNIGIPTVNGALYFHESYTGNPLVYCGTLGLVKKSKFVKATKPRDLVVVAGGRTGRDGIHGVTFASAELEGTESARSAVQIGDPIQEEKVKRALLEIRERSLAYAITDLGGGGLSSAVSEVAERSGCGVKVALDKIPLKYPMTLAWEIWVSESQERMLLSVPPKNLDALMRCFEDEDVEATVIGEFTDSKRLQILYKGSQVSDLSLDFLFDQPVTTLDARWQPPKEEPAAFDQPPNLKKVLLELLGMPNVASKEAVFQKYDHEVKGNTVLKPLNNNGPGDAAVLKPLDDSWQGAVLSVGMNPLYGEKSVYWMAASAIDEAIRNNVAVGGRRIALLDNFSWGSPRNPRHAAQLVQACRACYDHALLFDAPFISGKDSLYNESPRGPVTPTLLISALGVVPDVRKAVSMDFKREGNAVFLVGETLDELGGSHYLKLLGVDKGFVPKVKPGAPKIMQAVTKSIDDGLLRSCHDLSEGGLGVALAESCIGGGLGANITLPQGLRPDVFLFSESNTRFIVEAEPGNEEKIGKTFDGLPLLRLGTVEGKTLKIEGWFEANVDELSKAWRKAL